MIDKTKTVEEQIEELREKIACMTCNINFACGYKFGEVGDACKKQGVIADEILSQPITKPGGKCIWCLSGYYNLYDLKGGLPYCLKRTKCSYCKGTGILPDQTTTLKELIEGYLRR